MPVPATYKQLFRGASRIGDPLITRNGSYLRITVIDHFRWIRLGFYPRFSHLGKAEVQDLYLVARRNKNIGRFDITMDDSLLVSGVETFSNLDGDVE